MELASRGAARWWGDFVEGAVNTNTVTRAWVIRACAIGAGGVLAMATGAQQAPGVAPTAKAEPAPARSTTPPVDVGVDWMRRHDMDDRPELAITLGRRLLRRAPTDARVRAWYIASLDQARRFDELWAFARRCDARPADPWKKIECAYALATRSHGWRAGLDTADVDLRAAAEQRPGDAGLLLLATRLMLRRVEFSTHQYAPLVAFLDRAAQQTGGDYDIRAWRAAVRFDAAAVAPGDTAAQRAALNDLAALRRQQPDRVLAYRLAVDRLTRQSSAEALPLTRAAIALQPGAVSLRTTYWTLLLRAPGVEPAARRAAVAADIASWLPEADSSAAALLAASRQWRTLKRDSLASVAEDRLLARTPVSPEADDVLLSRAKAWGDSLDRVSDSTSALPQADTIRLRAASRRALDRLVFEHKFSSSMTRGFAASLLLNLVRADSSYPRTRLLAVARIVHDAPVMQTYATHAIPAVVLAERRIALTEAERWTREGERTYWRELDDMRSLYPTLGERMAALERWHAVFLVARAVVQIAAGRYADADTTIDRALAMRPGDPGALAQLGRLRLLQHRPDDAELAFVQALDEHDVLGANHSRRELERLYTSRRGSRDGWEVYLGDVRRRDAESRRVRILASELASPVKPPSFSLTALDGRVLTSERLRGKIVVVNFWGTWCGPCVGELPALQQLYDKYRSDSSVAVVTIAKDALADLQPWMAAKQYTFPTLLDEGYSAQASIDVWPTTWLLDREGKVRYRLRSTPAQLVEEWSWAIEAVRGGGGPP